MNIVFLGTPQFSVPSLEVLRTIDFVNIISVVTHSDKPKGRRLAITPSPVKLTAERYNIPLLQTERVSKSVFKGKDIDLLVVVSFGEILPQDVLSVPALGCINLHASLLPKYRGAAPITWAIINGEKTTGVTTFWLNEKMDSGDIILQKEAEIEPDDTRGTLEAKLAKIGALLLKETIIRIKDGTAPRFKQDKTKVIYAPKIEKGDGLIDWAKPAVSIHNKIRAMNPWPGAYTYINGIRIEIWKSGVISTEDNGKPGSVALLNKSGIGVSTGRDILLIKEMQAENKRRLKAVDFIHGYRINEGQVIGVSDTAEG